MLLRVFALLSITSLVCIASIYGIFHFRIIPDSLSNLYVSFAAKEGCSCIFVVNASEAYCKDYVHQVLSPDRWILEEDSLQVEFDSYFSKRKAKARFRKSQGCSLEQSPF
ncbi:hypothetical protein CH373_15530 [Leptospira perolatii]|uniref:Uncharacterized protein n=1 Tax=Leptospira perolatii TaxID=2023191 RepID=A0A2M9ZJP2_9LEPT|nr:hypothetical protein CH360_13990 [Leptospira perolatii]PJZ72214.1 hypothetical protein CH373_15530 [Leptospira perolatii]